MIRARIDLPRRGRSCRRRSLGTVLAVLVAAGLSAQSLRMSHAEPGRSKTTAATGVRRRLAPTELAPGANAWTATGLGAIRGVTVGPIESGLHPGKGYGSAPCARTMRDLARMGATWVSLTPFGRIWDLSPTGVDLSFEAPFETNRRAVADAVRQAHAEGLQVLLVPHLWVESGDWRGELDLGTHERWAAWAKAYERFVVAWARIAEETQVDLFSVGVELRHWVTTSFAHTFLPILHAIREVYTGPITYSGNWDDIEQTVILGEIDVIGINAFYPLAEKDGASLEVLLEGGRRVAERGRALAERWQKPVLFNEMGYTTRKDPAIRPWEWPDRMNDVVVDQTAQAEAYFALLGPLLDEAWFAGFFVWRVYADPDDLSQEAEWGFSPRGKLAELVMRDAFAAYWAADGPRPIGAGIGAERAVFIGRY